jgi:hypothetical protein
MPGDEEIGAVTEKHLKLTTFPKTHPDLWFVQTELQFKRHNISSEKIKFSYVVGVLDIEVLAEVSDIVLDHETLQTPYTDLKKRLINIYQDSKEKKLRKLLTDLDLGDKKPTALLREMKRLGGANAPDALLKSIFLEHMPPNIRVILASSTDTLQNLAEMADKIQETVGPQPSISAVSQTSELEKLIQSMETRLGARIDALEQRQSRSRRRSPSPYDRSFRPRSQSRNRNDDDGLCWYHYRFGKKAKKCAKPCNFQAEN